MATLFPKSESGVLRLIYENPGIILSELMKRARISYATTKKRLDFLVRIGVVRVEAISGANKVLVKRLYPNLETKQGKHVFSLIEMEVKGFK
ncbi:winged helix-turn-helix transcriptional regulator [Candidatus Woesearchaeota archaeon]|nr:winged helix-turn-helix transcriptional regulator [Candidatus Woesearchaeota archaeon]